MRRLNAPNSCDEALATKLLRLENRIDMYVDSTFNYGSKFIKKKAPALDPYANYSPDRGKTYFLNSSIL